MVNNVFFLGAGFSRAICPDYPLLEDLSKIIREKFEFGKESIQHHFINEIPQILKYNVEELLTFLSSDMPWKSELQKSVNKALYIDITQKIVEYLKSQPAENALEQTNLKEYLSANKPKIITLNYDLILENMLYGTFGDYRNLYQVPITDLNNRYGWAAYENLSYSETEILKLHGSINWLYSGLNASDPIYMEAQSYNINRDDLQAGLIPYIIPPVLDKNSFYNNNILKHIWLKAHNYLKQAREIYIIGFSFPMTDLSVKFLFQSALFYRYDKPKIYVVNVKKEPSYEELFKEFDVNYDYCCKCDMPKDQLYRCDKCNKESPLQRFINEKLTRNQPQRSMNT